MSTITETLNENQKYAQAFQLGHLAMPPARKLAIVACMDARMTVEQMLGLKTGDAHIIRNAGGLVTEDAIRRLIISYYLLGTREFMIINHTDCGMLTFKDAALKDQLYTATHAYSAIPAAFHAFEERGEKRPRTDCQDQIPSLASERGSGAWFCL